MKKLVLLAAVVFGLTTMNAQKNSILLGGNVGYSHTENKTGGSKDKVDSYDWSPYLGYQFSDHFTIAAQVSFQKSDLDKNQLTDLSLTSGDLKTTKIGGFIRYTQPLSETFAIYGDLGAGWQETKTKGKYENPSVNYEQKADGFYIGFKPALFINFKNNFGLNFSIGGIEYNHLKEKKSDSKSNGVDVTFGNAFNIGISKNFAL